MITHNDEGTADSLQGFTNAGRVGEITLHDLNIRACHRHPLRVTHQNPKGHSCPRQCFTRGSADTPRGASQ
jgi:hypothetical protein